MTDTTIPASWFYIDGNDKTMFNWFTYELACVLHENIQRSRKKKVADWRAGRSSEQIAEFCAYFAKRMKQSFFNKLEGNTDVIEIFGEYVSDYCHTNTHGENNAIIDVVADAWKELAKTCAACPNMCLVNGDKYCEMFDRDTRKC